MKKAMKNLLFVSIFFTLFGGCKEDVLEIHPECLRSRIETVLHRQVSDPPASIDKYQFHELIFYYMKLENDIISGCRRIVDEECNTICASGKYCDLLCPDGTFDTDKFLSENAVFIENVWTDTRKR
jgi:hypothetical protein